MPGPSQLDVLAERTNREFPNLLAARERTELRLAEKGPALERLRHGPTTSLVLMGSWGRRELTSGSDDDFMVLSRGKRRLLITPRLRSIRKVLDRAPGSQGVFGRAVFSDRLVNEIGLDADDNSNLTRRMLFILESIPATRVDIYGAVREEVLGRYLDQSVKPYRPPRFLLNDVVRYWRTMCVDFAGKEHKGPKKWGIRNAKLRNSRKILFAGGLLPLLGCYRFDEPEIKSFLASQFDLPPVDRIAQSFLENHAADAGARALGAYDEFVGLLDNREFRHALESVSRETAASSEHFAEMQRVGHDLDEGLLALLYETDQLPNVVREFAIF